MTMMELENWIKTYGKEIYSFCRYLTESRQEADDLYQDTFVKAVEQCKRMDAEQNPKSFLLTTAMNLWKNRKRKYAWRNRIAAMESLENEKTPMPESEGKTPEETLVSKEEKEMVDRAVAALREKYKSVILLYYMEDMNLSEIAGILNLPIGTVKSRLHKARMILKKELEVVLDESKYR